MVGLGQLDGALSVRGDLRVARDTVAALALGLLEPPWQNTVVVIVGPPAGVLPGQHGLVRIPSVSDVRDRAPRRSSRRRRISASDPSSARPVPAG